MQKDPQRTHAHGHGATTRSRPSKPQSQKPPHANAATLPIPITADLARQPAHVQNRLQKPATNIATSRPVAPPDSPPGISSLRQITVAEPADSPTTCHAGDNGRGKEPGSTFSGKENNSNGSNRALILTDAAT